MTRTQRYTYLHTCYHAHATTRAYTEKGGYELSVKQKQLVGEMGIRVNYIAAIGRQGSQSPLKVFYCFIVFFSPIPSFSFPLLF